MTYLITLLLATLVSLSFLHWQNHYDLGVGWRIALFALLFFWGGGYIVAGFLAPPEPRATVLQVGAAFLTAIPVSVAYLIYKNTRGW